MRVVPGQGIGAVRATAERRTRSDRCLVWVGVQIGAYIISTEACTVLGPDVGNPTCECYERLLRANAQPQ